MVDRTLGRNRNTTDTVTESSEVLNSSTATTLVVSNKDRMTFNVTNEGPTNVIIRHRAASADNDKRGTLLERGQSYWFQPDNIYFDEISAIAVTGNPTVSFQEM